MRFVPATALLAVLDGLGQLGLDVEHVRRQAGVLATIQDPETLLAENLLGEVWSAAFQLAPRESLPLEVGLAIPLGSFGLIDYLAASSDTVGEALHSLSRFFPSAGVGCTLEISQIGQEYRVIFPNEYEGERKALCEEFTLGVTLRHFRDFAESFPLQGVDLTRQAPRAADVFHRLFGAPVRFAQREGALRLAPNAKNVALKSRDPHLRRTLEGMATRLGLGAPAAPLEMVVRGRLRELLATGNADAAHVAASLALSTRTLQRKLAELGRSFQAVLTDFRRAEAERLLITSDAPLAEIALRLGFADQSAFSRAFQRWTELSPSEWRSAHAR
jgi:AraC-like DNA-binding protein